jgi:L-seryl-tRNA(Ser) seleniumtransferase
LNRQTLLRQLPSIDTLLRDPNLQDVVQSHGHDLVVEASRAILAEQRRKILAGQDLLALNEIITSITQHVQSIIAPTLMPVINATGVIVHTNLGRSLLSHRARQAMHEVAEGYSNLEYDVAEGRRGSRYRHAEALLCRLSGAEAAVVVNNNAAALILCLSTLAQGKEVVISRSQLVEIGGGFRIPDIMTQSGAHLVEVGSTNKTYIRDYESHLHPDRTSLILRVHQSNFKLIGFTSEPSLAELVTLGKKYNLPVMDDLGSGTLLDTAPYGLAHEPTIQESILAGASLVTASGDKLLGGPQAGLIFGQADIIARLKKHPLIRALRVDKTTLAALQATLLAYVEGTALNEIPTWQMISAPIEGLRERATAWQNQLAPTGLTCKVYETFSTVGGGSLPGQQLPTQALAITLNSPNAVAKKLRLNTPSIIARIEDQTLILDPRTVLPTQDEALLQAVLSVASDQ